MQKIFYVFPLIFLLGVCFVSFVSGADQEFPVSPPPLTEGIYPCSNCHASMEVNRKKRELKEEHSQIKLHHAETMRWCLDCHDVKNRDKFDFITGNSLPSMKVTGSVANVMGRFIETGKRAFMGKGRDIFQALEKEPTSSVHTATTPMSQNLNR